MADYSKPNPEELKRLRKSLSSGDRSPSTRAQAYQFVYWKQIGDQLGQPFDSTKIPISKLYQMRRDPMIAFALHYIKVPLIQAPWFIKCEDAQIAAFVDNALRRIYARYVLQHCQSLDFGFSAIVKRFELGMPNGTYIDPKDPEESEKPIWSEGNIEAVLWKPFVGLPPEQVEPEWTKSGEFNGIRYDVKRNTPLSFPFAGAERDDQVLIPLINSLWITNEKDSVFGSIFGYPRVGYAFRYWWSYWYRWALADRHFEKDADPPAVVRYPDNPEKGEVLDSHGEPIDYREIALSIGEQARSGSTIAMPSNTHESDVDGRVTNVPEWDLSFAEGGGNFDVFDQTFDRLEILKLRSIWVPEQAFLEGKGGTSSRNVAAEMGDSFEESQAVLMAEIDDHLNRFVIPQLIAINFPDKADIDCKKVTGGFGSEDVELSKALVTLIGQRNPDELNVDIKRVLERHGVPTLTAEQIKRKQEQAIAAAQAAMPPDNVPAGPGQAGTQAVAGGTAAGRPKAGQTKQDIGFSVKYVQPRERIYLSGDEGFTSSLPATQHYSDDQIKGMSREIRGVWRDAFSEVYQSFAEFIETEEFSELGLADDKSRADSIIKRWSASLGGVIGRTTDLVQKIMERAGRIELRKAKFPANWDAAKGDPAEWARRHAAELVVGVDETTRSELRKFLASEIEAGHSNIEIAQRVRDHFAAFPDWKADRLARTETMLAYNFATLYAAESAGVNKVQAIDARRGPTDDDCQNRNGRIYSVEDALKENLKEHPNGTLAWRLLRSTNLSVQKISAEDAGEALAWYDPTHDIIFMSEEISEADEEHYLLAIGQTLADA